MFSSSSFILFWGLTPRHTYVLLLVVQRSEEPPPTSISRILYYVRAETIVLSEPTKLPLQMERCVSILPSNGLITCRYRVLCEMYLGAPFQLRYRLACRKVLLSDFSRRAICMTCSLIPPKIETAVRQTPEAREEIYRTGLDIWSYHSKVLNRAVNGKTQPDGSCAS
jgi:hypothetical protein